MRTMQYCIFCKTGMPYNDAVEQFNETAVDGVWEHIKRVRKHLGTAVMFAAQPFSSNLLISNPVEFRHRFLWEKEKAGNFIVAKGQPLKHTEDILIFNERGFVSHAPQNIVGTYNPQMRAGSGGKSVAGKVRKNNAALFELSSNLTNRDRVVKNDCSKQRYPRDIIKFGLGTEERLHSTQKPVELLEYLVKTYTNENETVLDFTMGSGSTVKACLNLNRKIIGIENGKCTKPGHKYENVDWTDVLIDQLNLK